MKIHRYIFILLNVISLTAFSCTCTSISKPNNSPLIESVSHAGDTLAVMDTEIFCQASDPDGDLLQYEWTADNGKIIGTGSRIVWVSPDTMGNYTVSVNVSDGKGGVATKSVSIRVLNNSDGTTTQPITLRMHLPSNEVISDNTTVKVGTVTKVMCLLDNSEGSKASYIWAATGGKIKGKGIEDNTCATVYWTAPAETGVYVLSLKVKDIKGNEAEGRVAFDIFCCPRN